MLARMLQLSILTLAIWAGLWACAWWPSSAVMAILGVVGIMTMPVWLLMLGFATFGALGQDAKLPRLNGRQLWAAGWREVVCSTRLFSWHQAFRAQAVPDELGLGVAHQGKRGVVLLHGFISNRGLWVDWITRLRHLGHPYMALNLEPIFGSIDDYARLIEDAVQKMTTATGLPPVLVCHSMGGLAARSWLRQHGGANRVARIVTIGTPHHGTALGHCVPFSVGHNTKQMNTGSPWLRELEQAESAAASANETTTSAYYSSFVCYYSNSDNIVFPATTACLDGADNRHIPGVAHVALMCDVQVMDETFALIQRS